MPTKNKISKTSSSLKRGAVFSSLGELHAFGIYKMSQLIQEHYEKLFANADLGIRHFLVLHALKNEGPLTQQALCEGLWIDRATMVAVIKDLIYAKAVVRKVTATDKRSFTIELSQQGSALHKKLRSSVFKVGDNLLGPLSKSERDVLKKILHKLLAGALR